MTNKRKEYLKKYRLEHRKQMTSFTKKWRKEHPEQTKALEEKYYAEHPERAIAASIKWQKKHPGQKRTIQKRWRDKHKEQVTAGCKRWREENKGYYKTVKGKEIMRKKKAKRRQFGFVPLNKSFEDAQRHHINKEMVIYIPEEMHKYTSHSVLRDRNMNAINLFSFNWLEAEQLYAQFTQEI